MLILVIFAASMPFALRRPFVGLLVYFWISIMNPHRYSWGVASTLPLAQIAALVTLVSCLINFRELKFPRNPGVYLFLLFWLFITMTTAFALYPDAAWQKWQVVSKIFLMTLVTMLIVTTRQRLFYFILAIISYVGFIGVKGAAFGIRTGGQHKVWGPSLSFLSDNNDLGLALVLIIPLCLFMKDVISKKLFAYGVMSIGLASVVSAVLTYSRGALVGLATVGLFYFLNVRHKWVVAIFALIFLIIGVNVLPSAWFERMNTIKTYQEDGSANQRIDSWIFSYRLARAYVFGGGFECFTPEQYQKFAPRPEINVFGAEAHTSHSIYFEVMAEHGFGGLLIYLVCLFSMLFSLRRLDRFGRMLPGADWISHYSRAFAVSILGFMACGAFLSRALFDLFWCIYAAAVCFHCIVLSGHWIESWMLNQNLNTTGSLKAGAGDTLYHTNKN
jgi:probable O-glycosylation ligase (exosortase A-associated)